MTTPQSLSLSGIASIACGHYHALALSSRGNVYAWGSNSSGQLGCGDTQERTSPVLVEFSDLEEGERVVQVAGGGAYSLALTSAGRVFSWGKNISGQLGLGTGIMSVSRPAHVAALPDSVKMIACGEAHTLAVTRNSELFSWGNNFNNQLGLGHLSLPIHALPQKVIDLPFGRIHSISAGNYHSLVIVDQRVYGFGHNINRQLTKYPVSINDDVATPSPLIKISEPPKKLKGEGMTGEREEGELEEGQRVEGAFRLGEERKEEEGDFEVHCGGAFSVVLAHNNCCGWGRNIYGQLGGQNPVYETPVILNYEIAQMACGGRHTLALGQDGKIYARGSNSNGQLGQTLEVHKSCDARVVFFKMPKDRD
jgi:alpha-tubulin suppressor-like RCC1 family protein